LEITHPLAAAITNFGDLAFLLPLSGILALILWRCESGAAARAWLSALAFCLLATFVLKFAFLTCNLNGNIHIASPSGHASMSTAVYGALAVIVATHLQRWRIWITLLGGALVLAIALSRILLSAHTKVEVAIGLAIGIISLSIFISKYTRLSHRKIDLRAVGLCVLLVFAALYGAQLTAEPYVQKFAYALRSAIGICHSF
jgi:membrane-associated phospholipid phosphatase